MSTRREFVQYLPIAGASFAVAGNFIFGEAQADAQAPAPLEGHFHPQGKAPSTYTIEVLKQAKATLPFNDTRAWRSREGWMLSKSWSPCRNWKRSTSHATPPRSDLITICFMGAISPFFCSSRSRVSLNGKVAFACFSTSMVYFEGALPSG